MEKNLLTYSREILEFEQSQEDRYDNYYTLLASQQELTPAERDDLSERVRAEAQELEAASAQLRQAHLWAAGKSDELRTRLREGQASDRRELLLRHAPANSVIDLEEKKSGSFAAGMNFYKIALICIAGSFGGVVLEMLWCLFRNGYVESRAGLVYGPFNLLYGVGAVVMTLTLYRYRNRSASLSFLGGMLVGSVIEYLLSWAQQTLFGSTSWDYSQMPFNLNGRICLLYSMFWGILGVVWIKSVYPRLAERILHLPNRLGKCLTWCFVIFLAFNAVMSLLAVDRWSERVHGEASVSAVDQFFDTHFPDTRMQKIYANMDFKDQ